MIRLIYIATQVRPVYLYVAVAFVQYVSLGRSGTQRPMCLMSWLTDLELIVQAAETQMIRIEISDSEDLTWVWNCNSRGQDSSSLFVFVDRGEKDTSLSRYRSCTCTSKFGGKGVCNCE